ncbi:MAG: ABC transporter permease [Planctomycetes bacterium]|nr:ABC transporter permease [Planctomycetota bacterium]
MMVSMLGMVSAILTAIDIVSGVILFIMMLILGNTIAMGVRERIPQYGMLRAIGFGPQHVATAVVAEGVVLGLLGGLLGLGMAYPLVNGLLGPALEENMTGWFPYFNVPPAMAGLAVGLAVLLSAVAALPPAWQAFRMNVVEAVRRVG